MTSRSWEIAGTDAEPAVDPPRQRPREPRISVIVPALNEARNLREVLPTLPDVHEVILVDGGSVDGTVDAARETLPGIIAVTQLRTGKGNALAAGFARVTGDVVVMFDADGSADAREIPRFVAALLEGADFAKGSRFRPGGGSSDTALVRRLGNRFLHTWMNLSFDTRFTDLCYGYNAFWADLVPLLDLPDHEVVTPAGAAMLWGDGFEIETLINCRVATAGLSITEVPSVEKARLHGRSKLRAASDGWRVLRTMRTERARVRRNVRLDAALLETPDD
jgi:glycosyltransferase involved in cell wall biosynthesis